MSILKVILHHWNKTTQSYDNFHPETEVSQVTDWNNGIVNTLASTALGTLVNTLTSDSLLATMIQKVLTATGVKYSMGQNGYICFGSLFGGLIIQWGYSSGKSKTWNQTLPVAMNDINYTVLATLIGSGNGNYDVVKTMNISTSTLGFNIENVNTEGAGLRFIVIRN